MVKVTGAVHRVTYQNQENGYSVLKVKLATNDDPSLFDVETDKEQSITVTGDLAHLKEGEQVSFEGEWKKHPKYGQFLDVQKYQVLLPTTLVGLKKYLASDHFKGIGEALADRLVTAFGTDLGTVIERVPHRLTEIPGITESKASAIRLAWENAKNQREDMIALQGMGLSPAMAQKVLTRYDKHAPDRVRENPYQLADDIWGVGFLKADEIARNIGISLSSPERIQAGIRYTLIQAIDEGHMYLPLPELLEQSQKILGVNTEDIKTQIQTLINAQVLMLDTKVADDAIYLNTYHEQEQLLADQLKELSSVNPAKRTMADIKPSSLVESIKAVESASGTTLAPEQRDAVVQAFTHPVSVLTGGPGTGKSTAIRTVVAIAQRYSKRLALTAPTGRAAKRMSEITRIEASTLHRLLKLQPGDVSQFNQDNPLDFDLIVVDEVSMLDVYMALRLVLAIKPGTHLLLVGDADQLPSVQAGNVLSDLIASHQFPTTQLKTIFRQSESSAIITNAHRIRDGVFPTLPPHPTDFYLYPVDTPEMTGSLIVELITEKIPAQFGFDPMTDIQVLSPLYKTKAGVAELNTNIQQVLNPLRRSTNEINMGYQILREGDRVMQIRNNYDKEVFNGEVGRIKQIAKSGSDTLVSVEFDAGLGKKRMVVYSGEECRELVLSYAVSVHKSQGSEYPVVVMPVITSHFIMLQRNLLYTAVTRAKKLVVLVGQKRALYIALNNDKPQLRYSGLKQRLM
ncbi:ATP-dependent RecD-like DNA helicase [candidate division WWE3 bacterium]|nr:ATP-dependent RecD-like DNA helicase [candidate division WWE3 bacterium]